MSSNWKTEEEAKKQYCPMDTDLQCCASLCGAWVWSGETTPPVRIGKRIEESAGGYKREVDTYVSSPLGGCGLRRLP